MITRMRASRWFLLIALLAALPAIAPESAAAAYDITVSNASTTNVSFAGSTFTATASPATINAADLTTRLAGNTDIMISTGSGGVQTGTVTIASSISGMGLGTLTISGGDTASINAPISGVDGLYVANPAVFGGTGAVTASGVVDFTDTVQIAAPTVITTSSNVIFEGAIRGVAGLGGLSVSNGGSASNYTRFDAGVGTPQALDSLTTTGPVHFGSGTVNTTGNQSFNGDVTFAMATNFTSTSGRVDFLGNVQSSYDVAITSATGARLSGTSQAGSFTVNGGALAVYATLVETGAGQTFNSPVQLYANTLFRSGNAALAFQNAVDGAAAVVLHSTGTIQLNGPVGTSTPLTSLTVEGAATLNTPSIGTVGAQHYTYTVSNTHDVNLASSAGSVTFDQTVTSTAALDIDANVAATFERDVISTTLDTSGSALTKFDAPDVTVSAALTIGSTTISHGAQWNMNGASTLTSTGTFQNDAPFHLELTGNAVFNGTLQGTGDIWYHGGVGKSLTFGGTSTYSGRTQVDAGDVIVTSPTGLSPATSLHLPDSAATTLRLQTTSARVGSLFGGGTNGGSTVLGSGTLTVGSDGTNTAYNGVISGTGGIVKTGNGEQQMGGANTFTGGVAVDGGVLTMQAGSLPDHAAVNLTAPGTLALRQSTLGSLTGTGTLQVGSSAEVITLDNASATTFSGTLAGAMNFQMTGAGRVILDGISTSTGFMQVASGATAQLGSSTALCPVANLEVAGTLDMHGQSITRDVFTGAGEVTNSLTGTPSTLRLDTAGSAQLDARITGNIALLKTNSGDLQLAGVNTYTGATNIDAGSVTPLVVGALPAAALLDVASGGELHLANVDVVVAGAHGTGTLAIDAARTLTFNTTSPVTWDGALTGAGTLDVVAGGQLNVTGASPSFTGVLHVGGGTLDVSGALPGGSVVLDGAMLRGSGTVGSVQQAGTASIVSPGWASAATLHTGSLALTSDTTAHMDVMSSSSHDEIAVAGTVDLGDSTLELASSTTLAAGTSAVLIDNDGTDAVTGTFAGLAEGATITMGGVAYTLSYRGGTGNDVVLARAADTSSGGGSIVYVDRPVTIEKQVIVDRPVPTMRLNVMLGLDRYVIRARRALSLRVASSHDVVARIEVLRRGKLVSTYFAQLHRGRSSASIKHAPSAPGSYTIRITATVDGVTDTDTAHLIVRRMPTSFGAARR